MTDVVADAAPVAPAGAPIPETQPSHTPALGSQTPPAQVPEEPRAPEPAKSVKEAVARANEQLKAREAEKAAAKAEPVKADVPKPEAPKVDAKADPKVEQPKTDTTRQPDGKFAAREPVQQQPQATDPKPTQFRDAPSRFDDVAKTEWANAPESVKGAVHRAVKELEDGLTKYKASHDRYEPIREFDEIAKQNGRELKQSLTQVVEFEKMMKSSPMEALDFALRNAGPRKADGSPLTMNDIVQHVSGQSTDQRLQQAARTIHELNQRIQTMETQAKIPDMVAEFAASHERFDELQPVMVPLLKAGHDLETAYELADALKPASQATTEPLTPAQNPALAQTQSQPKPLNPAGQKSISGAPATGSDPAETGKRSKPISETPSVKDALKKAMARAS